VEYEVFYTKDEIKETVDKQHEDVFEDILGFKMQVIEEAGGISELKQLNKFIIEDWAPKKPIDEKAA
jgi:hypothetical protein